MEKFEKVNHRLLGEHIEAQLKEYILATPVNVGDKIPTEFELADMFGVGRSTIREAVRGLVTKGMLEVRRGSGTYVISTQTLDEDPLSLSRYTDKYELALELLDVRLMLEPEIAALAALNIGTPKKLSSPACARPSRRISGKMKTTSRTTSNSTNTSQNAAATGSSKP